MTGSNCPFFASSVKLIENFFSDLESIDLEFEFIVSPPLSFRIISLSLFLFSSYFF